VPGNHDVYNPHLGDVEAPWWAKLTVDSQMEAQYRGWFGPTWHSFSHGGWHFVAIDALIINSGLPEERAQWEWLEATLAKLRDGLSRGPVLFTHLPLFVHHPAEELEQRDFRNRYFLIAPPGRDRLLGLIRRYRVTAVLSGHLHVPRQMSHTWPEGFTTRFVTTGSSGRSSAMATKHFGLNKSAAQGMGFHEHWLDDEGLTSLYHQHTSDMIVGRWRLDQVWTTHLHAGVVPEGQGGLPWYADGYLPSAPAWQRSDPVSSQPFVWSEGMAYYVRQVWQTDADGAPLYLELLSERGVDIYLNGELLYALEPLGERPPPWRSAGGTYGIDGPLLCLGLSQRLVRKGENVLAVRVRGGEQPSEAGYIAYRELGRAQQREWAGADA
jgi:hypothetical protein